MAAPKRREPFRVKSSIDQDTEWIRVGEYQIPLEFSAEISDPEVPFQIRLRIRAHVDRPAEIVELNLTAVPGPINGRGLRRMIVDTYLPAAVARIAIKHKDGAGATFLDERDFTEAMRKGVRAKRRGGRAPVSDQDLVRAANAYRAAVLRPVKNPRAVAAKELNMSPYTLGHWLTMARGRELLGPAVPRRAGEIAKPSPKRRGRRR